MCVSPDVTPALANYSQAGRRKFPGRWRFYAAAGPQRWSYSKSNPVKGLELRRELRGQAANAWASDFCLEVCLACFLAGAKHVCGDSRYQAARHQAL